MMPMTPDERVAALVERRELITDRKERKWVKGEFQTFDIHRVPVELLVLNADNRRFKAEKLQWEQELGRTLDPLASEDDEESIISILLDVNQHIDQDRITGKQSKDTAALISDWKIRGQETPLWIRPDGWVINGNRRLAALKRLATEHGDATGVFSWVETIFLDLGEIDDNDLFKMEAREQLTEGLKLRYSDINLLLTLREAAERYGIDWESDDSLTEVAKRIQDLVQNDAKYAAIQLYAIKYMDMFLTFVEAPGEYQRLIGQVERFRDIGKNMQRIKQDSPDVALDLLEVQFHAVRAGLGHTDMREIRKLALALPERFQEAVKEVRQVVEEVSPTEPEPDSAPAEASEDEEEDPEEEAAAPPPGPPFPKVEVKRVLEVAIDARKTAERKDPELAIRGAVERLMSVRPADVAELLRKPEEHRIRDAIDKITAWLNSVKE
jgi:hypothetical protein